MEYGFLLFDKPVGISSFGALHQIDKHFGIDRSGQKLGHGGTLDPEASGLMVAAVGRATRLLRFFLGSDKRYVARFRLGQRTTTDDATGELLEEKPFEGVTRVQIESALDQFRGPIMQVPPDFSAIHVNGKRAYDLARKGKAVEIPARPATIYSNTLISCNLPADPEISLDIECSGGTYIRSIARDLGAALGCGAHMCALRRTKSCRFLLDQAPTLQELLEAPSIEPYLIPCDQAMSHIDVIKLSAGRCHDMMQGRFVDFRGYAPGIYRVQKEDDPVIQAIVEVNDAGKVEITRINTK